VAALSAAWITPDAPWEVLSYRGPLPGAHGETARPTQDQEHTDAADGAADDAAGCVAGCSAARDEPAPLGPQAFDALLERFATEPVASGSPALEALLYHHHDARRLLAERGPGPLDGDRAEALTRELARDEAWLDLRVVDGAGVERVRLGRTRVPLDVKQHLHPERRVDLQPLEVSGTVRRVGLDHQWVRI
jgi:hypothetical protein